MKIPEREQKEGLVDYAERLSDTYSRTHGTESRKKRGQFFTHKQVSRFMASLFALRHRRIRLLDPGAGTGVLTAAFCERILQEKPTQLVIDTYENDKNIIPFLNKVLDSCKAKLEKKGHKVKYRIIEKDFILSNGAYFEKPNLFWKGEKPLYDFVICNPPYYKLNKDSPHSKVMDEIVSGQPNIYALFMSLSASMVKEAGEMVFITPRSFCSGLYYKRFRKWFLSKAQIANVHIFESRAEIFEKDEVLQENMIIRVKRVKAIDRNSRVTITTSRNKDLTEIRKLEVDYRDVISDRNGESFIRIPASSLDVEILRQADTWPTTLNRLGLEISTGPVVSFRAREHLLPEMTKNQESVPLLWMHNMKDMRVKWPVKKNGKPSAISVSENTRKLLLPIKNYVLVKRFSSKEQKRRLYAALLLESEFPYSTIGIENHVNYIHRPKGNLSIAEAFGIAAILNTNLYDNFFRALNGNTQVNATDIRSLPLPSHETLTSIGEVVQKAKIPNQWTGFRHHSRA